ncbi:hypothetical protein L2E82_08676 [Cichorium intybus]|uniref:Uncharacterized protein n=1 Tax=Cichorium intybus TaxID=13427 RepID=A0ACB9G6R0_CICIN|nr:hypothetical protein L2E82_08676 [Cichorium intybus]
MSLECETRTSYIPASTSFLPHGPTTSTPTSLSHFWYKFPTNLAVKPQTFSHFWQFAVSTFIFADLFMRRRAPPLS